MLSEKQQQMVALFEKHVGAELEGDLDTTMATMSDDPHLNHVPTMAGDVGQSGVRAFYRDPSAVDARRSVDSVCRVSRGESIAPRDGASRIGRGCGIHRGAGWRNVGRHSARHR